MITCIGKQFMLDISSSSEATESFGGLHSEFTVGFARNENMSLQGVHTIHVNQKLQKR